MIDKIDLLRDFLSDENQALDFTIPINSNSNYKAIEEFIKNILKHSNIVWEQGIWSKNTFDEKIEKIFPSDL